MRLQNRLDNPGSFNYNILYIMCYIMFDIHRNPHTERILLMKKYRFACLLLVALCLVSTGCRRSALVYEDSDKYVAGDATISEPVRNLDLVWISGGVKIAYHPENTILLSESARHALSEENSMRWYLDGDTLRIRYAASGKLNFFNSRDLSKQLTLTLPEGFRGQQIHFDLTSASLTVPFLAAQEMEIALVSGDVSLTAEADRLKVETVSGKQRLNVSVAKGVEVSSVSGDVSLTALQLPETCAIETVSGNVALSLPRNASCALRFSSISGDFTSAVPISATGKMYLLGGGQSDFSIDTTSGDLIILEADQ